MRLLPTRYCAPPKTIAFIAEREASRKPNRHRIHRFVTQLRKGSFLKNISFPDAVHRGPGPAHWQYRLRGHRPDVGTQPGCSHPRLRGLGHGRNARASVSRPVARAQQLPQLVGYVRRGPPVTLALAYWLNRDATRATELVALNDAPSAVQGDQRHGAGHMRQVPILPNHRGTGSPISKAVILPRWPVSAPRLPLSLRKEA
jgi:hypothetical protein